MRYCSVTTDQWNRLIANPMVLSSKDEAPLAIWGKMSDRVSIDPESMKPRCTNENVSCIFALQVDIDSGQTIEQFVKDYSRYSFQLYTSYSYGFKPGDRFRVILPLSEPLYTVHLVPPVKSILHDLFDQCDVTCFDKAHWQILPCVRSDDAPYRYLQHQGELLSFARENFAKIAEEYQESAHWKREIAEADKDPNAKHDGALKYVQKIFDSTQEGARNRTVYAKLRWLHDTVGATYNEVITLKAPAGFDDEYIKMVERLYV